MCGTPSPPLYDFALFSLWSRPLFSLLVEADLPVSCQGQPQQQPTTVARISNERSREIIDGNFEFASHYAGLGHFGLMRIKDSKAMHFISIRQTTHGRRRRERRGEWKRRKGTTRRVQLWVWNQQAGGKRSSTTDDVYVYNVCFFNYCINLAVCRLVFMQC